MTFSDDSPQQPPDPNDVPVPPAEPPDDLASRIVVHASLPAEPADPAAAPPPAAAPTPIVVSLPPAPPPPALLPPDTFWPWPHLNLLWSCVHFFSFVFFALVSLIVIQVSLLIHYSHGQMSPKEFEKLIQSRPELAIGMNVLWFVLVFVFLYATVPAFSRASFWQTLAWRKFVPDPQKPSHPWRFFVGGMFLAIGVAVVSSQMKTPENLPIQDLLKSRTGALLLMSMAVIVAPFVEETVFRGYLYPLIAFGYSRAVQYLGGDPAAATSTGSFLGIVITGTLFGLLHGAQLGWTWGLVSMLITVGVIFTLVRARAGTVLASFLMHLGYNSMIALSALVSTRGFTHMPPHP